MIGNNTILIGIDWAMIEGVLQTTGVSTHSTAVMVMCGPTVANVDPHLAKMSTRNGSSKFLAFTVLGMLTVIRIRHEIQEQRHQSQF